MWAAQFYKFKFPRQLITSGGLGSMGYGLGAAIGVAMGRHDRKIINIAGDGCFRMNCNELATVRGYDLPIIEIIVNNRVLGMVRQWQTLFYGERYSNTNLSDTIDYMKLADAFGIKGMEITEKSQVDDVLKMCIRDRQRRASAIRKRQGGSRKMVKMSCGRGRRAVSGRCYGISYRMSWY